VGKAHQFSADAPPVAYVHLQQAARLLDLGEREQARAALQLAADAAPDEAEYYRGLTVVYRAAGLEDEAAAAEMAALALQQQSALMLYNLATGHLIMRQQAQAEKWFRAALRLDPGLVTAHQNLASILELDGRKAEAQYHRSQAYGRQSLFIDGAAAPRRTVLILCAAATGNVPLDYLLPLHSTRRLKWVVEYATEEQFDRLLHRRPGDPDNLEYDLVFNAIGDQDVTERSHIAVQRFLHACRRPVFNLPAAVSRTTRDAIPEVLRGIEQVMLPRTARLRPSQHGGVARAVLYSGLRPPMLLRPLASHGGHGLRRVETTLELPAWAQQQDSYASAFHDFQSSDGYYRKYRVIFVDRRPFPYHLAISRHWQVHYATADMLDHAWKREEELRFLQDPQTVLGEAAMRALSTIGNRLDLDFCGIDFGLLPDGRILVFEANATMLVHLEEFHACLATKNPYVQRILDAFDTMLTRS